jgi:hypothetical protein
VLGGVDPEASQQVAGAQQPRLHPAKNFAVGETYDPAVSAACALSASCV